MCPDVTFRHLLAFSADPVNFPPQPLSSVLCLGLIASLDTSTHSLGLGVPSSSCSCPSRTSLKVHFSAALSTQLSSLGTHLLIPIETCLDPDAPLTASVLCPLFCLPTLSPSTHTQLWAKLWLFSPHPSLERHWVPVSLVFLTSCLHSIPCAPCVYACVLCGAGLPSWTCMGHPRLRPEGQGTRTEATGGTGPAGREPKQCGHGDHHQAQPAGG